MKTRARIHGEPLNPIFALLPVGLLALAVLSDLAAALTGFTVVGTLAFWNLGAAVIAALPATAVALFDVSEVPSWSRAKSVVMRYGLTVSGMTLLTLFCFAARWGGDHGGTPALVLLQVAALGLGISGAWWARALITGQDLPDREPAPPPRIFPRRPLPSEMATVRLRPIRDRRNV
jgi:uncharacterized membrane protein